MTYQSNKPDRMAAVEEGGWTVAWADDISETDVIEGVVAAGVSIYAENPEPFLLWVRVLVNRTISSLLASAENTFPDAIRAQVESLAAGAIRTAIQGRQAWEMPQAYDTVDFKAGAIQYDGENIEDLTGLVISRTWGIKPYVAFRWRGSGGGGQQLDVGQIRIVNDYGGEVDIQLYHPQNPSTVFSSWHFMPNITSFLGVNGQRITIGSDWGIQIVFGNGVTSPIRLVGDVSAFDDNLHTVKASRIENG